MRTNVKSPYPFGPVVLTAEGALAKRISAELQLRRLVLACLLFENNFYSDGKSVAERIEELCAEVAPRVVAALAVEARHEQHLRHVPLLLLRALVKRGGGSFVADAIESVISRADELSEFVALYWSGKGNKKMLPAQMKKGLARAFGKFNEYALGKYDRDAAVKLRDVLFLIHAKPRDADQAALWKRLIAGELATPDTWEVELSAGKDKRATFERLIRDGKLGYFALLRNLRNMADAGCDERLVKDAILARGHGADKVLPFRFVAAARAAPRFEREIDAALCVTIADKVLPLRGRTVVLVDVSNSMNARLSAKSDMTRLDAAAALASVVNADNLRVFVFSSRAVSDARRDYLLGYFGSIPHEMWVTETPPRRGMAGVDAIIKAQEPRGGTLLFSSVKHINATVEYDRLIVITDEQAFGSTRVRGGEGDPVTSLPDPRQGATGWMINVASEKNGVGYGRWRHIDGWSDSVLRYIAASENLD